MGGLDERIASLSPENRALLEQKLMEQMVVSTPEQMIPRRATSGPCPLSFAQQRLWILDQVEPNNAAYNVPKAWRIHGDLNITAVQKSLSTVLARHEALRTTFSEIDGNPMQVVQQSRPVELPVFDLTHLPREEREAEAQRILTKEASLPFDLSKDLLLRAVLVRLDKDDHVLLLTTHHIASDGWSIGVLLRELSVLYKDLSEGQHSTLPELPIQYADFALWQRRWFEGERLDSHVSYWKHQLAGTIPALEIPTDKPRPVSLTFQGARQSKVLSQDLSHSLKTLSQQESVTLFMTLLAAFQTLLFRYTGQTDIIVGCPAAGRSRVETEGLIGFFVNTLVLRTDLSGNPTFRELLERVHETALGAFTHQDLPFEKLVKELHPERDLSRNPLFQVMFVLQNTPVSPFKLPDLTLSPMEVEGGTSQFDLSLSVTDGQNGLIGKWEYNTDLFEGSTVSRMMSYFQTLLEGIVASPEKRIADLPILAESERHQLLVEWNDTSTDYPKDKCIQQLFEAQVERTPDAVAVIFEDEHLTYRELNRRANQLAHHLRRIGVGPEVLVGVFMERSLELVIALYGILKAGGAYVPLDPEYPSERLAFMISDTKVPVLLTQSHLVDELPEHQAQAICLDSGWEAIPAEGEQTPDSGVTAENLAYVIYTSGSTGQPKGVMIPHRAICNHMLWMQERFALNPTDRVIQKTPFSFDASVWELFAPLLVGGQLIVARPDGHLDSAYLAQLMAEERVTILQLVPSQLRILLEEPALETCTSLRLVICGGETLSADLPERLRARLAVEVHNLYGPTEATIDASSWLCETEGSQPSVPIGRPIANTQIYLLDAYLQPVPVGVPGELHIGGAGLARGYLNRHELTDEKFILHPFSNVPGARLYRTGDLARYLPGGTIDFLGRIDHQVKVRGFRIELGEIEAVLSQHPALRETAVLAREDIPGDKRLIAYVIPKEREAPTTSEMRSFLQAKLPDYMVPSAFVILDSLPLTPNGKVDRQALPVPDQTRPELEGAFVAPSTTAEEVLADIWAEVLGIEQVGVHDDFFELGGHSLLAIRVRSRILDALKVELPLRTLFESTTVAELAKLIESDGSAEKDLNSQHIPSASRSGELPLSSAQQRLWFLDKLDPGGFSYNIPTLVRVTGPLNVTALEQSLNEIVRRHEGLRTTFSSMEGRPVQVITPSSTLKIPMMDLRELSETDREGEVRRLSIEEAQCPFNLAQGPLLRVKLLCLAEEKHVLLLTMHHIISDGWSIDVLFRELEALYEAFSADKPSPPLPELPIQYADFALWQRQWLEGRVLEAQLSYWIRQLNGAPSVLELPADRPRPPIHRYRGARQHFALSRPLSDSLKALSRQEGVTLYMSLLAVFQVLLHRYSSQDDIVVGSPIAGRNRVETEALIGLFVNTLVIRTDLSGNPSFLELLGRVRDVTLGAYAHQDLPFEKLVEELHPERNLSHNPLFQVMFTFQNAPSQGPDLEGLNVSLEEVDSGTAKVDLTLSVVDTEHGLSGQLGYNTEIFDDSTITRLLGHYQSLLESIVANPEARVSDLPMLTEAESHQLLVEWNDTLSDFPMDSCIHQLFEAQVERTPNSVAVVFGDKKLTYRELNWRSNQLGHHLRKLGVGPDVPVGICLDPSEDMIVGLLGILKAGGAYVPLDPAYPKERLAFMLEDTQAPVLLTQERLLPTLPEHSAQVVCLDSTPSSFQGESQGDLINQATAEELAYIMYTSGSTGTPKGISVPHRAVTRLVMNTNYADLGPRDRIAQVSNFSFDAATFEIWGALLHGAQLIGIPKDVVLSPQKFATQIRERGITTLFLTTALFNLLAREVPRAFSSLKYLLFGGEASDPKSAREILKHAPPDRLLHVYGPTESTTFATWYLVQNVPEEAGTIPIGRPISNTHIYLLDSNLQPVPVGVPGEIFIGGNGLARGYVNRPELTEQMFVPDPFSDVPDAIMYKTGDLARYMPDGNLEFLGRVDDQLKVRGFRVEPGEIEAVMNGHPAVESSLVIARDDEASGSGASPGTGIRLVAYVVPKMGKTPVASELLDFTRTKLPDYMVPSAFVMLDSMPLTPNGKVDRQALPAPEGLRHDLDRSFIAPRDELERRLARIWERVLGVRPIGVRDNFFDLGGALPTGCVAVCRHQGDILSGCSFSNVVPSSYCRAARQYPSTGGLDTLIFFSGGRPGRGIQAPLLLCPWRPRPCAVVSGFSPSSGSGPALLWRSGTGPGR